MFYAPLAHLYDYESVYLDGLLSNEPEWTRHVKKLLSEWQEFILYVRFIAYIGTSSTVS